MTPPPPPPPPPLELCPGRWIGGSHPVFLIAEIGQNHQGDLQTAKRMITAAREAGADCVKFQKSNLKEKFNGAALAREYSGPQSWGKTYGEHKAHLELSEEDYRELQAHATQQGVFFTASAMDSDSARFLERLQVPFVKVGSGDSNNLALQLEVAGRGWRCWRRLSGWSSPVRFTTPSSSAGGVSPTSLITTTRSAGCSPRY